MVGAVALLLPGMTATSSGQGAAPSTRIRPIEDFLNAQGTEANGIPAPLNTLAWIDPQTGLLLVLDYAGLINQWIEEQSGGAISIAIETEGKVIERPLPDGRAEVTVLLHTKNAFTAVAPFEPESFPPVGPALLGHHAWDVAAGMDTALGESLLKWVFFNDAPGAPLPDLLVEFVPGPSTRTIMLSFEAHAEGTLREEFGVPDGTPGQAQVTQIGLFRTTGQGATADGFPAEHINLSVVGR